MSSETDSLLKIAMPGIVRDSSRYLLGVSFLLGVVVLWTASNFITASLETGTDSWNKPFMITYLNTASFAFYLIPSYLRLRKRSHSPHEPSSPTATYQPIPVDESDTIDVTDEHHPQPVLTQVRLTIEETARAAAVWAVIWFAANWTVNAALGWTSVASVTILSSTSGLFTLALGSTFGVEKVTNTKVFSALASFIGVILVTRSDSSLSTSSSPDIPSRPDLPTHPIIGDIAALASAACYAAYSVYLKKRLGDEDRADPQLLLGFAGLFSVIGFIPAFPLLHWTGIEKFQLPPTRSAWIICGINGLITLSSDYLYVLANLKTSPLLVTIGLSLTIPLALFISIFVPSAGSDSITVLSLLGAGMVLFSFVLMGLQGWEESKSSDHSASSVHEDGNAGTDV